jgi:hypothetical protein
MLGRRSFAASRVPAKIVTGGSTAMVISLVHDDWWAKSPGCVALPGL